jgi:hypothetical protein
MANLPMTCGAAAPASEIFYLVRSATPRLSLGKAGFYNSDHEKDQRAVTARARSRPWELLVVNE